MVCLYMSGCGCGAYETGFLYWCMGREVNSDFVEIKILRCVV